MILAYDHQITPTRFPDGTSQVWKLPQELLKHRFVEITWRWDADERDFVVLSQLKRLLDHAGVESSLTMTYLPYGRQDKQILNDQCGALRVFAEQINTLGFNKVRAIDPHSEVAAEVIDRFEALSPLPFINAAMKAFKPTMIAYPDDGAFRRYGRLISGPNYVCANKKRDQSTGEITSLELISNKPIKFEDVLIVDDICDGGATFIRLGEKLTQSGARRIGLFTTHGIYSKGLFEMKNKGGISRFYCQNGEATILMSNGWSIQSDIVYKPFLLTNQQETK